MKQRLLLLLIVVASAVGINAQNTLNIHQKSGGKVSYAFSEKPIVSYTDAGIHLVTSTVEIDYPFSNLLKFTFEDSVTPIGTLCTEGTKSEVNIYTVGGVLVKTTPADGTFSTNDLPAGIYIIKNGTTTYKITKR